MRAFTAIIRRLTYANVAATLALVLALGGTAYAVELAKDSVKSKHIKNNSVKSKDIKDGNLTGADVAGNSLGGAHINEGSLGTVPNAAALGGTAAAAFTRDAGHVKGSFTEGSPLSRNIPGFGTVSLRCNDQNTVGLGDDLIGYGYSLDAGAGAVGLMRVSQSSFPFDPPTWTMYNSDSINGFATINAEDQHLDVEHYLTNGTHTRAFMVTAWGYNDIPNPGCNGVIEIQRLR